MRAMPTPVSYTHLVGMPRKTSEIVLRDVIAEIIEQEERVNVVGVFEAECAAQMNSCTFESRFGFDKAFDGANRHVYLQPYGMLRLWQIGCVFHMERNGSDVWVMHAPIAPAFQPTAIKDSACRQYGSYFLRWFWRSASIMDAMRFSRVSGFFASRISRTYSF